MKSANKIIDFQEHLFNKDIDSRIKSSRDDTLKIIQADIKMLDAKIEVLDAKVDKNFEVLNTKIGRLEDKIDNVVSMRKWIVGMFITILLAIAALAVPVVFSLIN